MIFNSCTREDSNLHTSRYRNLNHRRLKAAGSMAAVLARALVRRMIIQDF
jgi:hypothetical protein